MNVLIIGLGSAGQRHARVIREAFPLSKIFFYRGNHFLGLISEDLSKIDNSIDPSDFYGLIEIKSIDMFAQNYNLIVIATPPDSHMWYLDLLKGKSKKFIIEKPLSNKNHNVENYKHDILNNKLEILVGYQHFYNPIFKYIRNKITGKDNIKNIFMKHYEPLSEMNPFRIMDKHHLNNPLSGGVLLGLSHEIDFCLSLFPKFHGFLTAKYLEIGAPCGVKKSCVVSSNSGVNNLPKVKIELSYSEEAVSERSGIINTENTIYSWDLNKKIIDVRTTKEKYTKKLNFSSDELVRNMLIDFMSGRIDKRELVNRFDRAAYIIKI